MRKRGSACAPSLSGFRSLTSGPCWRGINGYPALIAQGVELARAKAGPEIDARPFRGSAVERRNPLRVGARQTFEGSDICWSSLSRGTRPLCIPLRALSRSAWWKRASATGGCVEGGASKSTNRCEVRCRHTDGSDLLLSRRLKTPHIAVWRYDPMAEVVRALGFMTNGPFLGASCRHAESVAEFRAALAGRKSPLDSVAPAQLAQARKEFRDLPEVAGTPYGSIRRT